MLANTPHVDWAPTANHKKKGKKKIGKYRLAITIIQ